MNGSVGIEDRSMWIRIVGVADKASLFYNTRQEQVFARDLQVEFLVTWLVDNINNGSNVVTNSCFPRKTGCTRKGRETTPKTSKRRAEIRHEETTSFCQLFIQTKVS